MRVLFVVARCHSLDVLDARCGSFMTMRARGVQGNGLLDSHFVFCPPDKRGVQHLLTRGSQQCELLPRALAARQAVALLCLKPSVAQVCWLSNHEVAQS